MSEIWLSQKRVSAIENVPKRSFWREFQAGRFKTFRHVESSNGGRGGKKLEIALSCLSDRARVRYYQAQRAERRGQSAEDQGKIDEFDRLPQQKKDGAFAWLSIIERFEQYAGSVGTGKRMQALKDFVPLYRIDNPDAKRFSAKTLRNKTYDLKHKGLMGLVSGYGKTRNFASWPEEAKAWIRQRYLNQNQPTAAWCIGQLKIEAKRQGWQLPSDKTLQRFLAEIDQEEKDYRRQGRKYWLEHYVPSVLRDYESMTPGELYVADHQQVNVAVRNTSGQVFFPWLTAWMDMRSRKILGWVLAKTPDGNTINLSLKRTIEKHGAPEHVVIDNGRDFSAKRFTGGQPKRFRFKVKEDEVTGIYKQLKIEPHFCIPGNARAKNIERWFWTQEQGFQKAFATYRGNNIMNRPEGVDDRIKKGKQVPEWDDLTAALENYIENYNQDHKHRGHGMDGRTPNEVWNEHFAAHAQRRVSPSSLRLLMMASRRVKVGRFGVAAFKENYRGSELMDHQGKYVIYRYDPDDIATLYIYTGQDEYIGTATRVARTAWNSETAHKEVEHIRKKREKALKTQREADEALADVEFGYTHKEPTGEHEDQASKVVRILHTPLDGVEKQIEREQKKVAACGGAGQGRGFSARLFETLEADKERQKKQRAPVRPFMNLTIDGAVDDEE